MSETRREFAERSLVVRKDHVLCTICGKIEPVHAGDGTAMPTLLAAYSMCVDRHSRCTSPTDRRKAGKQ